MVLLADIKNYRGKAIGSRLKRLATAGLMLERLGVSLDNDGALKGLAVNFQTERSISASLPVSQIKPVSIDDGSGMSASHGDSFDMLMDNVVG